MTAVAARILAAALAVLAGTLLPAAVGAAAPARLEPIVLQLDPAQTQVEYSVHSTLHTVHGRFTLARGTIRIVPASGEMAGSVVVDASSGSSGNHARDTGMRNGVLEADRYPEIRFTPQQLEGELAAEGEFPLLVRGILSLHGADHEVAWTFWARALGDSVSLRTHFTIPYVAWGLKDPSLLFLRVADTVDVSIHTVGILSE